MRELALDRHVLASNATPWDTAWGTYGWTPALEGARASRLEEEVPWGTRSARLARPPRLSGPLEDVLDPANLDRLGRSLLPVDGRLGFSVWGAVGGEKVGSEWRVATHTLLLDADELRALGGHPDGLLAPGGRAAPWLRELAGDLELREPTPLAPFRLRVTDASREALGAHRRDEIARLRLAALRELEGDREALADTLADAWEALAAALTGGRPRHVAVHVGEDGSGRDLLRLLWLTLPLEDRLAVSWVTEQRRAERPPGHLIGLPRDEWGRYVPEDAWVLGGSDPVGPVSPGRRHWAELVAADDPEPFRRADGRAVLRGWRIVQADDLRRVGEHAAWRARWEAEGPTGEAVEALAERELRRRDGPRAGAVGDAVGRAVAEGALDGVGVVDITARLDDPDREALVRGAVRALRRAGRPAAAARLRVDVTAGLGAGGGALVRGLRRLVDRESPALRALLASPGGPEALVRGAFRGAASGDGVALELARVGVAEGRWDAGTAAQLADALPVDVEGGPEVAADLLLALVEDGADGASVSALAGPLLDRAGPSVAPTLAEGLDRILGPGGAAVDSGGVEALRQAALLRVAAGGGSDLDGAVVALVALGARTAPPERDPEPWEELVEAAPAPWLSRAPVLSALVDVLGAGRRPLGEGSDSAGVASLLARRVLGRAGAGALDDARATALLRLVWLEGDGSTLRWLVGTRSDASAPLLARMLVTPAPLELQPKVRAALVDAMESGADIRGLEPLAEALGRWAPAVAGRIAPSGARFVPLRPGRA